MKKVSRTWDLDCSAERFWDVFSDLEYSRTLYLEALRFKDYRVISGDAADRKLALVPTVNAPGPLAKLIGDAFAYEQHGKLDRGTGVWTWKMVYPGGKKGIVSTSGTMKVVDTGEGKSRRTDEVNVEAHIFGVGGMIESTVEKELNTSWEAELTFFRKWLVSH